ncbi:MAG: DUF447 family protein [Phycisphaera sp.]|nr:DUF447 family protein [Phycisphaera sp.]
MPSDRPDDSRIIEGLVTTLPVVDAPVERVHVAPMGPIVDSGCSTLLLRPFRETVTFRNLVATGVGVFHETDGVGLIARSALGEVPFEELGEVERVEFDGGFGVVLLGACRYHVFRVEGVDDSQPRTRITARVVKSERLRDFGGFNRARFAVIEVTILATRLHLTGKGSVLEALERYRPLVDKTGSGAERQAFEFVARYIEQWQDPRP